MVATILGGVGVFLVGMILMTDGLRALAGDALRRILSRFVSGRFTSLLSGAASTMLVQSSSATTFVTIGFVSAGLITFPQAVVVTLGANIGTTSTGWIVSVLGFKVSLGAIMFPLVGAGAMLRLFSKGRRAHAGMALAGFGLLFVGIDILQLGMAELADHLDPASFPQGGLGSLLLLVAIGILLTVVLQSSSAAVATSLAALHSGTIDISQGAALVIGSNIGTTVKVLLLSIGASVPVKRTAAAHVFFNVITGIVAIGLLPLLLGIVSHHETDDRWFSDTDAIAAFHTGFNVLGVLLFFPWVDRFAALIIRLIPDRGPALTRHLDSVVAGAGPVAIEAARRATKDTAAVAMGIAIGLLDRTQDLDDAEEHLAQSDEALIRIRKFLGGVRSGPDSRGEYELHVGTLHAIDHLSRLLVACREYPLLGVAAGSLEIRQIARTLSVGLRTARASFDHTIPKSVAALEALSLAIAQLRRDLRPKILAETAEGSLGIEDAQVRLEAVQCIDRIGYHAWRALHHLQDIPYKSART